MNNKMIRCMGCMSIIDENQAYCPYCGYVIGDGRQDGKALKPGTVLKDKYVVGKVLGEGGFGITYLGWDSALSMKIAIKEYYPSGMVIRDITVTNSTLQLVSSSEQKNFEAGLERYMKEATILSQFSNLPGIVSVKDFFHTNGTAYIVMEYIEGISLKDYLMEKGGRISAQETLELMKPVLSSLDVVHKNHLLHRDISPDNIMIGRNGVVKLIDFGAARYFESDYDKSMTVVLKHGYAPIEQYSRNGNRGEWTDIYSLCATMYRMVTGTVPIEALERLNGDKLLPINKYKKVKVPKYFRNSIEKGMSVQVKDRQQNLYELYQELYERESIKKEQLKHTMLTLILSIIIVVTMVVGVGGIYLLMRVRDNKKHQIESILNEGAGKEIEEKPRDNREILENKVAEEEPETIIPETEGKPEEFDTRDDNSATENAISAPDTVDTAYQIIVVRDGILHTVGESYTVGEIFDAYSDAPGTWKATAYNASGVAYVYYTGTKEDKIFTIEFEVYTNDKFVITGATENNQKVEDYNIYIQKILEEAGI